MLWEPIAGAPRDGSEVTVAEESSIIRGTFPWPITARFIGGVWCANCGPDEWRPFEPQPTHYFRK